MRACDELLVHTPRLFCVFLFAYTVVILSFTDTDDDDILPTPTATSRAAIRDELALVFQSWSLGWLPDVTLFHLFAVVAWFMSCIAPRYDSCSHGMLRLVYVVWTSFYAAYGIYELAVVKAPAPHSHLAMLCLVLAVCTLLFGVASSVASEREQERQDLLHLVHPEG